MSVSLFEILINMKYSELKDVKNTNPEAYEILQKVSFWTAKGLKDFKKLTLTEEKYVSNLSMKERELSYSIGVPNAYLRTPGIPKTPLKSFD